MQNNTADTSSSKDLNIKIVLLVKVGARSRDLSNSFKMLENVNIVQKNYLS